MDDILNSINILLSEILVDMTSESSSYIDVAKLVAGLGALILSVTTFSQIMSGKLEEPIANFCKRVFLISLGIGYYGVFLSLINLPLNIMSESIKANVTIDNQKTDNFFDTYTFNQDKSFSSNAEDDAKINELLNENNSISNNVEEQDQSGLSDVIMNVFDGSYQNDIKLWILESFYSIVHFLGVIAIVVLNVIRTFFLIVLSTFGIFVLALSMYPGLENSFSQWLQKYINVYLWLPIGYILQGMISKLFTMIKPDVASNIFGATAQNAEATGTNMIVALLGICSLVAFSTVPTLSSWMVNAATTAMGSKVKGKAMNASKSVSKGLKTATAIKTGGASAAVSSAIK